MKKILLLFVLCMSFPVTACADSDIDKIKGCWKFLDSQYKITDTQHIQIGGQNTTDIELSADDTFIVVTKSHRKLKNMKSVYYINKKQITDTSFVMLKNKNDNPEYGLKYTRIECPR